MTIPTKSTEKKESLSEEMAEEEDQLTILNMPMVDFRFQRESYERGQVDTIRKYRPKVKALEATRKQEQVALASGVFTLCGSVRFRKRFDEIGAKLCFAGYTILSLNVWGTEPDTGYIDDTNPMKKTLEAVHFKKIDLSEGIIVVNPENYVGKSTKQEIEYATRIGKKVYWDYWYEPSWKTLLPAARLNPEAKPTTTEASK